MPQFQSYPSVTTVAPDDLVLIHQDASGVEKTVKYSDLVSSGYLINVKSYGAVGDGVTNDSAAVQAAFNAAIQGSVILFPATANSYIINTPISVPLGGITVIGYGAVLSQTADTQYRKFTLAGKSSVWFNGLSFNGGYSSMAPVTNNGTIYVSGYSSGVKVTNCQFINTAAANIYLSGECANVTIENNTFFNNYCPIITASSGGLSAYRLKVANNQFSSGGISTVASGNSQSIWISGAASNCLEHVISGNSISSFSKYAIRLDSLVINSSISGNSISNAGSGIYVVSGNNLTISGNTLSAIVYDGIYASGSTRVTISGNSVTTTDSNSNGIKITTTDRGLISANNILSAGDAIVVVDCLHPSVTGNLAKTTGEQVMILAGGSTNAKTNAVISGNNFVASPATRYHILLEADAGAVNNALITSNFLSEAVLDAGINLKAPNPAGPSINDVNITANNTTNAVSGGLMLDYGGTSNPQDVINRVWCSGNLGQPNNRYRSLNVDYFATSNSIAIPYAWFQFQNGTVGFDASGGAKTFELPPSGDYPGWRVTIEKTDSSTNPVTISGYGGTQINGQATYVLRCKGESVTLVNGVSQWNIEAKILNSVTLVYRGSNQSIPNNAETTISWLNANNNSANAWSIANPDRIYVPAGAKLVRVSCNFRWAYNATGTQRVIKLKASGGSVPVFATSAVGPAGIPASFGTSSYLSTPIIKVSDLPDGSSGYFYVTATQDSGGALDIFGNFEHTNFQIEVIE